MIKIGICDDESVVLEILKKLVSECADELQIDREILTFLSGRELFLEVKKLDVIFLDILMPDMDGIEVGKKLRDMECNCKVIMSTSMVERFKEAFKINAFRFITKPFQKEEIREALEAVLKSRIGMDRIELYKERNLYTILQRDIIYARAINSAVECMLANGIFRKEIALGELEHILDGKMFYRINKQQIVNMREIKEYKDGKVFIDGLEMRVSIRRKKAFEKAYTEFRINYM